MHDLDRRIVAVVEAPFRLYRFLVPKCWICKSGIWPWQTLHRDLVVHDHCAWARNQRES